MKKYKITYKEFLEAQLLKVEMSWEERRKYIGEYMGLITIEDKIVFLNPLEDL